MNKKQKKLFNLLSHLLIETSQEFLVGELEESIRHILNNKIGMLMDLILSAHISSCFTILRILAHDDPHLSIQVENFINTMENALKKINTLNFSTH